MITDYIGNVIVWNYNPFVCNVRTDYLFFQIHNLFFSNKEIECIEVSYEEGYE